MSDNVEREDSEVAGRLYCMSGVDGFGGWGGGGGYAKRAGVVLVLFTLCKLVLFAMNSIL